MSPSRPNRGAEGAVAPISFRVPVWLSAYRYREKVYRFLVNARTGEVQGERPWSWIKITLAALAGSATVALIAYLVAMYAETQ